MLAKGVDFIAADVFAHRFKNRGMGNHHRRHLLVHHLLCLFVKFAPFLLIGYRFRFGNQLIKRRIAPFRRIRTAAGKQRTEEVIRIAGRRGPSHQCRLMLTVFHSLQVFAPLIGGNGGFHADGSPVGLDLERRFNVDFSWTIDCCELGEIVYENFNAAAAEIRFTGVTAHPMSAKGVLVNPLLMATDFISHFDRSETPEHTEGREGYVWFNGIDAGQSYAVLNASIRDFDLASFERRKQQIGDVAGKIAAQYPTAKVTYQISDTYSNISNAIGEDRRAIDLMFEAMESLGITPKPTPMRGGTDGAALSAKGLLTPNFFTGAHNFHSKFEFLPLKSFEASYNVALQLCLLAAR